MAKPAPQPAVQLNLVAVEVIADTQLVELRVHSGEIASYLTLQESEALIKRLSEANAKLRGIRARDGFIEDRR